MRDASHSGHLLAAAVTAVALSIVSMTVIHPTVAAQQSGQPSPAPKTAQAVAPLDLTGYWVSVVTEDWRWRMVTPPKGDYESVPLNEAGRKVLFAWDPAKDEASGGQCKAYGAAGIMRIPGRLHITWEAENALKIETDAGRQTRRLLFDQARASKRSWQGQSVAEWEHVSPLRFQVGGNTSRPQNAPPVAAPVLALTGSLKVMTSDFRAGYLRKNGVPYSENAIMTEYFDETAPETNGDVWLTVTTIVDDPQYLTQPFFTSTHYKREPDASKWNPTPCQVGVLAKPVRVSVP